MPLSDTALRTAKPKEKPYRLSDGNGLTLLVQPNGGMWWRFRYHFLGAEKMLSLGTYPDVSLKNARDRCDAARKLVAEGVDPSADRKQQKRQDQAERGNSFKALANEWHAHRLPTWATATAQKIRFYLDSDLIPMLGERPAKEIKRFELIEALRILEKREAFNVAKKARGWLNQIFRYAIAIDLIQYNPATDLDVVAAPMPKVTHYAALSLNELPSLIGAIQSYGGNPQTRYAIQILMLTAVRPGELRNARWSEFDLPNATWAIPPERMKMRRPHVVPLPTQAVRLLIELQAITGSGDLLFPSRDDRTQPMSDNTISGALRRLGYKGKQTGHGFRHLISTALNERGYNRDWIERQLSHGDDNEIRDVYNKAQYLDQRRRMMQDWADSLDQLSR